MENLTKIQCELKVPKGNFNSFGKYKYRSAEDILEAVKPLLLKHTCTLILTDEVVAIGNKIFMKSAAMFSDNGKVTTTFGYAETSEHKGMSAEQTSGTASSYSRKYALNGLFLIDETEQDADHDNKKQPTKEAAISTTATELPPLTDKAFASMLKAIEDGKGESVRAAMGKYTMLALQENELNNQLNKK